MSALNEKIYHQMDRFDAFDEYNSEQKQDAANAIELLVIQDKIDLLSSLKGANSGGTEMNITWELIQLNKKLKQLLK